MSTLATDRLRVPGSGQVYSAPLADTDRYDDEVADHYAAARIIDRYCGAPNLLLTTDRVVEVQIVRTTVLAIYFPYALPAAVGTVAHPPAERHDADLQRTLDAFSGDLSHLAYRDTLDERRATFRALCPEDTSALVGKRVRVTATMGWGERQQEAEAGGVDAGTLPTAVGAADISINDPGSTLSGFTDGAVLRIGDELILVGEVVVRGVNTVLRSLTRGYLGTTATAHAIGDTVQVVTIADVLVPPTELRWAGEVLAKRITTLRASPGRGLDYQRNLGDITNVEPAMLSGVEQLLQRFVRRPYD